MSINQRSDVCLLHIICDFLFHGFPCSKKENMALQCPESYGIRSTNGDIPVYVSCKFKMYNFKIALVISETVCIAFLFVLSIYYVVVFMLLILKKKKMLNFFDPAG